jgi:hypothetical protein
MLHKLAAPNKVRNGRWGFCGIFEHFSRLGLFCSQTESQPAPLPLTQTVSAALDQDDYSMEI